MGGANEMINRSEITLNSSFGRVVNNMLLIHSEGSKNIAILFQEEIIPQMYQPCTMQGKRLYWLAAMF